MDKKVSLRRLFVCSFVVVVVVAVVVVVVVFGGHAIARATSYCLLPDTF